MRIEDEIKLTFDDVLIRPKRSTLVSRSEVDLTRPFKFKHTIKHGVVYQFFLQIWIQLVHLILLKP